MDVSTDPVYFQLFGLPVGYDIDTALLATRYREQQQAVHPDRHAAASPGERLRAVQLSTRLNEAYHCLRQPLARATYLLQLAGQVAPAAATFQQDRAFLTRQLQWREALAGLPEVDDPLAELDRLAAECRRETAAVEADFRAAYAGQDWTAAAAAVARWQFLEKFHAELDAAEQRWQDA